MRILKFAQVPTLDNQYVRAAIYADPQKTYKKYGLFLNGRSEWIEKYQYFYADLQLPDDVALIILDHRGQGASAGTQSYIKRYLTYAQDVLVVRNYFMGDQQPDWIIAHSMGSLIALYSQIHGFVRSRKLFLLSPLLGLPQDPVPTSYAKLISGSLTAVGLGRLSTGAGNSHKDSFNGNPYTADRHRYEEITHSKYRIPPPTFGWVRASIDAIEAVFEPTNLEQIKGEVYILLPGCDPVVDRASTLKFKDELEVYSEAKVTLKPYDEARHELLSESHKIYSQVAQYIRKCLYP